MAEGHLKDILWGDPRRGIAKGTISIKHDHIERVSTLESLDPRLDPETISEFWIPGFVDIHCDAIEKVVEPRPRVHFPLPFAIDNLDRRLVCNGVTSSFHAIAFAGKEMGLRSPQRATALIDALDQARPALRSRSFVHVRYEVSDPHAPTSIGPLIERGAVDLLSFMDHYPGQGQFQREKDFIRYLMLTYTKTEKKCRELLKEKRRSYPSAQLARDQRVTLVCHDLDNPSTTEQWASLGISVSEFPLTLEAARASLDAGLATLFGAPNLVRGESSGNGVKASDAIDAGVATGICSDYLPESLLSGFETILRLPGNPIPLPQAVGLFTENPAQAAGRHSLGRIGEGYPADLIRVAWEGTKLRLKETIIGGKTVFFEAP